MAINALFLEKSNPKQVPPQERSDEGLGFRRRVGLVVGKLHFANHFGQLLLGCTGGLIRTNTVLLEFFVQLVQLFRVLLDFIMRELRCRLAGTRGTLQTYRPWTVHCSHKVILVWTPTSPISMSARE